MVHSSIYSVGATDGACVSKPCIGGTVELVV